MLTVALHLNHINTFVTYNYFIADQEVKCAPHNFLDNRDKCERTVRDRAAAVLRQCKFCTCGRQSNLKVTRINFFFTMNFTKKMKQRRLLHPSCLSSSPVHSFVETPFSHFCRWFNNARRQLVNCITFACTPLRYIAILLL